MTDLSTLTTVEVEPDGWRPACQRLRDRGGSFCAMYVHGGERSREIRAVFDVASELTMVTCSMHAGKVQSIVDIVPAAAWDERELHDVHDIVFAGHHPMRPLVTHSPDASTWTVARDGSDGYDVFVGPVHAGVIESGHFRFFLVGERILHLDLRLFYKRRGVEALAIGSTHAQALQYIARSCASCTVSNSVAFVHAVEIALGQEPDDEVARARTVLLELERTYNLINDLSAICAGIGFAPGTMAFASLKEQVHQLNLRLSGHRFLFDTIQIGGSSMMISSEHARAARRDLAHVGQLASGYWRDMQFNASVAKRLDGIGVVDATAARELGAVGPIARAAGIEVDVRTSSPRLVYPQFCPVNAPTSAGDVAARTHQRWLELEQSLALLDGLLSDPIAPGTTVAGSTRNPVACGVVESPRGRTTCIVECDEATVLDVRLRTSSFANWPIIAHAVVDEMLPEFPLINKSFELCYACCDR